MTDMSAAERDAMEAALARLSPHGTAEQLWLAARDYYAPAPEVPCVVCGTTAYLEDGGCAQCVVNDGRARELALREALWFMRSCELSGESGADHPMVLSALAGRGQSDGGSR